MSTEFHIPEGTDFNRLSLETTFYDEKLELIKERQIKKKETLNEQKIPIHYETLMNKHIGTINVFSLLLESANLLDFILEAGGETVFRLREMLVNTTDSRTRNSIESNIKKHEPSLLEKNVIIIKYLQELAETLGYGLGVSNMTCYIYNGTYWEAQPNETVSSFLSEFSIVTGLKRIEAQQFKQKENITKQFFCDAEIPQFNIKSDEIRIPFINGTLLIKNGKVDFVDFNMKHFLKYQLQFIYDPEAKAPLFQKTLDRILPDETLQLIILEFFGYVFAKNLKLEKMLVLLGPGGNGKSVIYEIMKEVLGKQNVTTFTIESLCDPKSTTRPLINGKLLNYSSEANFGRFDADIFKTLVSNEATEARHLFRDSMMIEDYGRFCLNCNVLPRNIENSDAFYRRFLIIPFTAKITEEEKDVELPQKIIAAELPGIFNLIIEGMKRLIEQKAFTKSPVVETIVSNFRRESNSLLTWLDEEMYNPINTQKMRVIDFYQLYRDFCKDSGFSPLNNNNFKAQLRNAGFEISRSNNGYYHIFYEKLIPGIDDSAIVIKLKPDVI